MATWRHVVLEYLVFQHAWRSEVFATGNNFGQAGAAFAFAATVGDTGTDFFGYFNEAGAGRYGDRYADILKGDFGFRHCFPLLLCERRHVDIAVFYPAGQVTGQLFAEFPACVEFIGIRYQLDAQAFDRDAQLQAAQAILDQAYCFAAPAIGAEGGAELALDIDRGQR